jgi:AbrB family transcriptional regulator (stage V sporulation protein T)
MRATGIIRRVDDLGSVAIPRDIRHSMGIREGEPLEIYLENDAVVFRKYSHKLIEEVERVAELVEQYCKADYKTVLLLAGKFREISKILKESEDDEE